MGIVDTMQKTGDNGINVSGNNNTLNFYQQPLKYELLSKLCKDIIDENNSSLVDMNVKELPVELLEKIEYNKIMIHKELYEDAINKNFKSKEKENITFYFLRGAIDFTKLKIHHALMMLMNRKILATKNIQTEDDKIFLENYGKKLDYLSKNSINDIVSDIKNYLKEL